MLAGVQLRNKRIIIGEKIADFAGSSKANRTLLIEIRNALIDNKGFGKATGMGQRWKQACKFLSEHLEGSFKKHVIHRWV
jgi:hypothetical protein